MSIIESTKSRADFMEGLYIVSFFINIVVWQIILMPLLSDVNYQLPFPTIYFLYGHLFLATIGFILSLLLKYKSNSDRHITITALTLLVPGTTICLILCGVAVFLFYLICGIGSLHNKLNAYLTREKVIVEQPPASFQSASHNESIKSVTSYRDAAPSCQACNQVINSEKT